MSALSSETSLLDSPENQNSLNSTVIKACILHQQLHFWLSQTRQYQAAHKGDGLVSNMLVV
jgi:hypothetical protein